MPNTKPLLSCGFFNHKPGVGKTTSAMFLSSALHCLGLRVLLVDADRGMSALQWADLAKGVPWEIVHLPVRGVGREIVTVTKHRPYDAVIVDCPQIEDHEAIARSAMEVVQHWIVPVAPAGIELDRMQQVIELMDRAEGARADELPVIRWALLNRTNTDAETKRGVDSTVRDQLVMDGFKVFASQIKYNDRLYRQTFGEQPPVTKAWTLVAHELLNTNADHIVAQGATADAQ